MDMVKQGMLICLTIEASPVYAGFASYSAAHGGHPCARWKAEASDEWLKSLMLKSL